MAALVCCGASHAHAEFLVVDENVLVDAAQRTATFRIKFNTPPNFTTVDEFGRQADEFQYYIDNDASLPPPETPELGTDIIIRGGEIARTGKLVVRAARKGDGALEAGGWGAVRGLVPYASSAASLEFTVSWDVLQETDGKFSYFLLLVTQGETSDTRPGVIAPTAP